MMDDELRRAAAEAGFIWRGRIEPGQTPQGPPIPAAAGEALAATVEEVLHSTDVLRGLTGRSVTLVTRHAAALKERQAMIFFTDCVSLGDPVLLRELAHLGATHEASRDVAELLREKAERPLVERLAGAELVVAGTVADSRILEQPFPPRSEHDPQWGLARVTVETVFKGAKPKPEVEVLFASSTDIAWYRAPKLHRGMAGLFLLRRAAEEDGVPQKASRTLYKVTDPLDFLPRERRPDVERLVPQDGRER
jgi:hypothetical protein